MSWAVLCAVLVSLASAPASWAQSITPEQYTLVIDIDSDSGNFSGTVDITAKTNGSTSSILLVSSDLVINTVTVLQNSTSVGVSDFVANNETETLNVTLSTTLVTTSTFTISLSFTGSVSSNQSGLYNYTDSSKKFFVTNLYPAYARRLFPCFDDQPGLKAIFQLTLITTLSSAISNTAVNTTSSSSGTYTYAFNPTPAIPPSSFFFIAGSLTKYYSSNGKTLWLSPSFGSLNSDYYRAISSSLFTSFHALDGMSKLDIIAIPELKSKSYSGYGVVVFRSDVLEIKYDKSTNGMKRESLLTMLYGLFKIFYGTLTVPATWAENYISDSVATFLSYEALSNITSTSIDSSNYIAYFFTDVSTKALDLCTSSTTVIGNSTMNTSSVIEAFVTGPSMMKGAAILQMVSSIVPDLSNGLLICYNETKNESLGTNSTAFLNCLNTFWSSSSHNLDAIISPWLEIGGCPLITTSRGSNTAYVAQEEIVESSTKAESLIVPVTAVSNADGFTNGTVVYLSGTGSTTELTATIDSDSWVVVDAYGQGYYRTQYDYESWSLLCEALASNVSALSNASLAKLVSDAFWVAKTVNNSFYETLPDSIQFMANDSALVPWKTTVQELLDLWNWVYQTGTVNSSDWMENFASNYTNYTTELMLTTYDSVGITVRTSDSPDTKSLRKVIVASICDFGYSECLSSVQDLFEEWKSGSSTPSSDMLPVIICNGLKTSDYDTASNWLSIYNTIDPTSYDDPAIRNELYEALACPSANVSTGNSESIEEFLSMILSNSSSSSLPLEDVPMAFKGIYKRPEHTTQALAYFLEVQPSELRTDIALTTQVFMLNDLANYLTTDAQNVLLNDYQVNNTESNDFLTAVINAQTSLESTISWIKTVQSYLHAGVDPAYASAVTTPSATTEETGAGSTDSTATTTGTSGSTIFTPSFTFLFAIISFCFFKL